ncbi:hypothetical protein [Streptomyces avermitilis]
MLRRQDRPLIDAAESGDEELENPAPSSSQELRQLHGDRVPFRRIPG